MNKLQRAHSLQMRNVENFALSVAIDMFRKKGQEVRELFEKETQKFMDDYQKL